jgi:hypothetical protein
VVPDVNVVVGLVGGGLDVVEVGAVLVGGGVDVGVGAGVDVLVKVGVGVGVGVDDDDVPEPQDTVKPTYWFWPLEVTVVLAGVIVQPGTVLAVSVTLASGQ